MSYYYKNTDRFFVGVPFTVTTEDKRLVHQIEIRNGDFRWVLPRELSEFKDLDTQLQKRGLPRKVFPTVETTNNLHEYLQVVLQKYRGQMPKSLRIFLEMRRYDCYFIVDDLYDRYLVEKAVALPKRFDMSVMELHALCRVFRETFPDIEQKDCLDYGTIVEDLNSMKSIYVEGSDSMYFRSPNKMNDLKIDFCFFKTLEKLEMMKVSFQNIESLGTLRSTLVSLKVYRSRMLTIGHFLLSDTIDKRITIGTQVWHCLQYITLNNCEIMEIDISIRLAQNLKDLRLVGNRIKVIPNLRFMSKLEYFDLSCNDIADWDNLHEKFTTVKELHVASNKIKSLRGFRGLKNLEYLDVNDNCINDLDEVTNYVVPLKKLKTFILDDNPVTTLHNYDRLYNDIIKQTALSEAKRNFDKTMKELIDKQNYIKDTFRTEMFHINPPELMMHTVYPDSSSSDD